MRQPDLLTNHDAKISSSELLERYFSEPMAFSHQVGIESGRTPPVTLKLLQCALTVHAKFHIRS
jgi:hypothetical protein